MQDSDRFAKVFSLFEKQGKRYGLYQSDKVSIIAELSQIIASTAGLDQTLQRIAIFIEQRFSLDVCSVYLF